MRMSVYSTAVLVMLTASSQVFGLNINRNFSGGTAPPSAAGGGTLSDVFDAAADWWEMAIFDNHTVTIGFSWAPINSLGQATVSGSLPFTSASVKFDNDGTTSWFVDPTPHQDSEWTSFSELAADLGGGPINVRRKYTGPTGDAVGRYDLLTVAKHEIGHALGIIDHPTTMADPTTTTGPRPNPGTMIFTTRTGGGHIDLTEHPDALMIPNVPLGQRKLQTGIDILLAAQRSGFTNVVLDPLHMPEPGDMNQDGNVTVADSPLFIEALVNPTAYAAHGFPFPADEVGDVNLDGTFDLGDLAAFGGLFTPASAASVPEPSAFLLALIALASVAGRRRKARFFAAEP